MIATFYNYKLSETISVLVCRSVTGWSLGRVDQEYIPAADGLVTQEQTLVRKVSIKECGAIARVCY